MAGSVCVEEWTGVVFIDDDVVSGVSPYSALSVLHVIKVRVHSDLSWVLRVVYYAFLLEFRYGLCIVYVGVQFPPLFTFFQGDSDVLEGSEDYLSTVISVGVVFP